MEDLKLTLKQQIIDSLNLQGMKPEDIDDNAPLFGEGLGLDSIDSLELMVLLERNYGIKIEDAREGRRVLQSVSSMEEYIRQVKAVRARGSPMPPVTLRVLFENRGTTPLEVEVTTVDSELGNFAVRPAKFTVPPGEKFTLEPMISQLGVTSDEIPLKLELRAGAKKESQVVLVKNVLAPSLRK